MYVPHKRGRPVLAAVTAISTGVLVHLSAAVARAVGSDTSTAEPVVPRTVTLVTGGRAAG
jgi:hypothetical protein